MNKSKLLGDLRSSLHGELSEITGTSGKEVFPETFASFNGLQRQDYFNVLSYLECRFTLLECIGYLEKILCKQLTLYDLRFILKYGKIPVLTHPGDKSMEEQTNGARTNGIELRVNVARCLQKLEPLIESILNDHPRKLNLIAYHVTVAVFRGHILTHLLYLETILVRLILERQSEKGIQYPLLLRWMGVVAKNFLTFEYDKMSLTSKIWANAVVDFSEVLKQGKTTFKTHFVCCPDLLSSLGRGLELRDGMVTFSHEHFHRFTEDITFMIFKLMEYYQNRRRPETLIDANFHCVVRFTQNRVRKMMTATRMKRTISSLIQLKRDMLLLPPCMQSLLDRLQQNGSLSNSDRYYLIVFLKKLELPLKEAEKFLRDIYERNPNLSDRWTTIRAGHLRRTYRNEKQNQYGCKKFDRYCIWRRHVGTNSQRILAKIRNSQNRVHSCSAEDFKALLESLGNQSSADESRASCATLGCFRNTSIGFHSPLGYYYNTKAITDETPDELSW